jgi:hypothetical protein
MWFACGGVIVYIPAQLVGLTGGRSPFEVGGTTVRQVIAIFH